MIVTTAYKLWSCITLEAQVFAQTTKAEFIFFRYFKLLIIGMLAKQLTFVRCVRRCKMYDTKLPFNGVFGRKLLLSYLCCEALVHFLVLVVRGK